MTILCSDDKFVFAQANPPVICRSWEYLLRQSARLGYRVRCRRNRCSLDCYQNWRQQLGSVLARYLNRHRPDGTEVHRGHLKMPKGSTPNQHSDAITKFLRTLRRAETNTGHVVQVHLAAEITAPDAQHWDMILYTTMKPYPLRDLIRVAWSRAGGDRYSLTGITDPDLTAASKYQAKDTAAARKSYTYLPAENGMNITRHSSKFFGGTTKYALWQERLDDWFGDDRRKADANSIKNIHLYDTTKATI